MHLASDGLPADRAIRQLVSVYLQGDGVVATQIDDLGGPEVRRFGLPSALPSLSGGSIPHIAQPSGRVRHATSLRGLVNMRIGQRLQPSAVGEDTFGDDRQLIRGDYALPGRSEEERRVGQAVR